LFLPSGVLQTKNINHMMRDQYEGWNDCWQPLLLLDNDKNAIMQKNVEPTHFTFSLYLVDLAS
jgi:hypothetical protein